MELFLNNRISRLQTFDSSAIQLLSLVKKGFLEALVLSSSRLTELSRSARGLNADYRATLLVDGSQIDVSSNHYFQEGEYLQLRTASDGGLIAFGRIPHPRTELQLPLALIESGLRRSLPAQASISQLYPLLKAIANAPASLDLPNEIVDGAQSLMNSFPTLEQVQQVELFRQAMFNSGSFLESKLAHAARFIDQNRANKSADGFLFGGDFKAEISKFIVTLKSLGIETSVLSPNMHRVYASKPNVSEPLVYTPQMQPRQQRPVEESKTQEEPFVGILLKKLSRLLVSTLAKIQVNQLVSLEHQCQSCNEMDLPINSWLLDLPIAHDGGIDVLNVQIEQQPNDSEDGRLLFLWTIRLNFEFMDDAHILFELNLMEETLSVDIWSEPASLYQQIMADLDALKEEFRYAGANVSELHCHLGVPECTGPLLKHRLVDLHT